MTRTRVGWVPGLLAMAALAGGCGGATVPAAGGRDAAADSAVEAEMSIPDRAPSLDGTTPDRAAPGPTCKRSSDCSGTAATFCQKDSCDPEAPGTCALIPGTRETGFCPGGTDFVCGCDGRTYAYACLAHAVSVNVAAPGPCPLPDGGGTCASDSDCGSSALYCRRDTCAAAMGTCTGRPDFQVCYAAVADGGARPVCGCDHETWSSDCEAASTGVSVDFPGSCPPLPSGPCTSQADCGGASFAKLVFCRPSACGAPAGQCTALSNACPDLYDPVCGCDGVTYVNSCFSDRARVGLQPSAPGVGCPAP